MALVCSVMVSSSACTKALDIHMAEIPDPYKGVNQGKGPYFIRTHDGRTIQATRFKVTETGFLIEAVKKLSYHRPQKLDPPLEIKFQDIASVSRREFEPREKRTSEIVSEIVIIALYISIPYFPTVP